MDGKITEFEIQVGTGVKIEILEIATAKAAPIASQRPDVASIRHRIADARKQIGIAFEKAQRLGTTELSTKLRSLSAQQADLGRISSVKGQLVRMIKI